MQKWTLAEGLKNLSLDRPDDAEINDLGISRRQLTLDVSFANGEEDGVKGISVILTLPDYEPLDHEDSHWHFSRLIEPAEGESLPALAARIAKELGIEPNERVWEDGEQI